jgi:hypothetical protein
LYAPAAGSTAALVTAFGWGAVAVPALIGVWAADSFLDREEKRVGPSYHTIMGSGLIIVAVLGLLHGLSDDPLQWALTPQSPGWRAGPHVSMIGSRYDFNAKT